MLRRRNKLVVKHFLRYELVLFEFADGLAGGGGVKDDVAEESVIGCGVGVIGLGVLEDELEGFARVTDKTGRGGIDVDVSVRGGAGDGADDDSTDERGGGEEGGEGIDGRLHAMGMLLIWLRASMTCSNTSKEGMTWVKPGVEDGMGIVMASCRRLARRSPWASSACVMFM